MTPDLSDFGGGITHDDTGADADADADDSADDADDTIDERNDDAQIAERCRAVTSDGDRCANAVSHMACGPVCGVHRRVDDVELVDADGGTDE